PDERRRAVTLYKSLQAGAAAIRTGETDAKTVRSAMVRVIQGEPAMAIDYLAVCDPITLEPLPTVARKAVLLGAVRLGTVRLIDNMLAAAKQVRRHP
ncbi:MAG: pantoate--beta-alanine ligase, partial [Nitrospira sp.]|nr:pantoate--beta-alanine ligase [Nitrospira sp.]